MITLEDLKICNSCGNIFSKNLSGKALNRCPACSVWKKEIVE